MVTQPRHHESDNAAEFAVYWFARLVTAASLGDFVLANEARRQLSRLGWSVVPRSSRRAKGGAR